MKWNIKTRAQSLFTSFTALAFVASFSVTTVASETVAMITDLTGNVSITSNGVKKKGEILMSISPGDEVRVKGNSKLTLVYFKSAKEYTFPEKSVIKINTETPENKSGSKVASRNLEVAKNAKLLSVDGEYSQAAIVFRSARKKPKIKLIRPINSRVLDTQPNFEWEPLEEVSEYRFVLMDDSGRTVIETLVNGTSYNLPSENKIVDYVLYTWRVEARLATGDVYTNSTSFSLLDDEERGKINRLRPKDDATFSERLVFAILLEQMGVRDEAYRYWNILSAEKPDNKLLQRKTK